MPAQPVQTTIQPYVTTHPLLAPNGLMNALDQWDKRPQKSREGGTNGYMHVSSLINIACDRRATLISQSGSVVTETVTGGHRIMWAQGRATEAHIRDAIIGATGGECVYGVWECRCGHAKHRGFKPAHEYGCERCGHPLDVYGEVVLEDHEHRITGSVDLSLVLERRVRPVEIKSMTPDQFDGLKAPLPDHVTQLAMYGELYRRNGFDVHTHGTVVYGRKQFRWGGGKGDGAVYKQFDVDLHSRAARTMVETCFATALELARHNATRTHPPRRKCDSIDSKLAKKCPVAHLCFSL